MLGLSVREPRCHALSNAISNPAVWSFSLAFIACAGLAALLLRKWRRGLGPIALAIALAISSFWALAGLEFAAIGGKAWWQTWIALEILRHAAWSAFVIAILAEQVSRNLTAHYAPQAPDAKQVGVSKVLRVETLLALCIALTTVCGIASITVSWLVGPGWWDRYGIGASLLHGVLGLACVEHLVRRTRAGHRWGIGPLALGLGGLFAFSLYTYADALMFAKVDPPTWSALGIVQATAAVLIGVAMLRDRQWTVQFAVSHRLAFRSSSVCAAGIYLALVAAAGYYTRWFGGSWGATLQAALLFVMLVLLIGLALSGTARAKLRVLLVKHLFSYRYDYREEWLRVTRMLASAAPTHRNVHESAINALADLVESPGGALWIRRERGFELVAQCNVTAPDALISVDHALSKFLDETGWLIDLAEARVHAERYSSLTLPGELAEWSVARLVVPLSVAGELIGFVVLAEPRVELELDWEARDLLKTAACQAASYIAQAVANAALVEAEKFSAFNRMSAFVVHDLKNLAAQLSLVAKNAERHRGNPEFQDDMLASLNNVTGRMNGLLRELRAGHQPIADSRAIDLGILVQQACSAWTRERAGMQCVATGDILVCAHPSRLQRAIENIVKNAVEATAPHDRIHVSVTADASEAVIAIADEGVGMTREFIRERLFKPFQTTKPNGTGIGMYETERYIASLGGRLEIDSKPGGGTHVTIHLPRHHATMQQFERAAA